jgi:hypothetical protein
MNEGLEGVGNLGEFGGGSSENARATHGCTYGAEFGGGATVQGPTLIHTNYIQVTVTWGPGLVMASSTCTEVPL